AGQAATAPPPRLARVPRRPPGAGDGRDGRGRAAANSSPGLHGHDRLRRGRAASHGGAALALGALRPSRAARSAEPRGPCPGGDRRRADAARARRHSVGAVERAGRSRPRHHHRSRHGRAPRRLRSAQRRRGPRPLGASGVRSTAMPYQVYALKYAERDTKQCMFFFREPSTDTLTLHFYLWVILGGPYPLVLDTGLSAADAQRREARKWVSPAEMLSRVGVKAADVPVA